MEYGQTRFTLRTQMVEGEAGSVLFSVKLEHEIPGGKKIVLSPVVRIDTDQTRAMLAQLTAWLEEKGK